GAPSPFRREPSPHRSLWATEVAHEESIDYIYSLVHKLLILARTSELPHRLQGRELFQMPSRRQPCCNAYAFQSFSPLPSPLLSSRQSLQCEDCLRARRLAAPSFGAPQPFWAARRCSRPVPQYLSDISLAFPD